MRYNNIKYNLYFCINKILNSKKIKIINYKRGKQNQSLRISIHKDKIKIQNKIMKKITKIKFMEVNKELILPKPLIIKFRAI